MNTALIIVAAIAIALVLVVVLVLAPPKRKEGFAVSTPPPSVATWSDYPVIDVLTNVMAPMTAPNAMSFGYPVSISGSITDHYYDIDIRFTSASFNTVNFGTPVWTLATETAALPDPNSVAVVVVPMSGTINLSYMGEMMTDVPLFQQCPLFSSDGSTMTMAYTGNLAINFIGGPYDPSTSSFTYIPVVGSNILNDVSILGMVEAGNLESNWLDCYSGDFSGLLVGFISDFLNQCVTSSPNPAQPITVTGLTPPPYPQCYTPADCSSTWAYACMSGTCIPTGGSGPECPVGGHCDIVQATATLTRY